MVAIGNGNINVISYNVNTSKIIIKRNKILYYLERMLIQMA